jgi:DNA-binding transcriptional LysR family regulator
MQFEALKIFCDVARKRSFSQAAAANDITQSAVSHTVSQLEKRVGVRLIDRSTRPLQLTAPGRAYYEGCKELLERYDRLEASLRGDGDDAAGTVRVAAIYSVGLGDMGQYVERFAVCRPQAHVHIEYLHPNRVYEKVLEGSADLGLVSFPKKSPRLTTVPWRDEEMVLACPPGHPLARNVAVRPRQLLGEKYVHFTRDLVIRRRVDRFLREQGAAVEVALEFDNVETIKKAVAIGAGVALLPEPTLRPEVAGRSLVARPLYGCRLVRPLAILHRRRPRLCPAARSFLELLCGHDGNGRPAPERNGNGQDNGHARPRHRGGAQDSNSVHGN